MDIITLGIETSCDETACAVVKNGRHIMSNIISSQAELHSEYGGVVPEIASRMHVEAILPCLDQALKKSNLQLEDISAICVTSGPGLVGALLVGVSAAKGLAVTTNKPLIAVNHIQAHIAANYIQHKELKPPFVCLVVSGGHTEVYYVRSEINFEKIAQTRDDAAGEAIDKIARVLGLGYPGGPKMDRIAQGGDVKAYSFPRPVAGDDLDFSFSGIKTHAINQIHRQKQVGKTIELKDFAASYQYTIAEALAQNTILACERFKCDTLCLAGGVSANSFLRSEMYHQSKEKGLKLYVPSVELCTDNAAMVASAGYYLFKTSQKADLSLNACPNMII